MKRLINIFPSPAKLAANLAEEIVRRIKSSANKERNYSIALSGGSTPELLYSILGDEFSDSVPWEFVQFFWGDERCVPPESADSNYSMAKKLFLDKIDIPRQNIHRIRGEEDPEKESQRYSDEISFWLPGRDGLPLFDLQIMGIGEDGHTASIFPGYLSLLSSDKICEVTIHPDSKQKRITLTGRIINNSEAVVFLIEGKKKAGIVDAIIKKRPESESYPATHIIPVYGSLDWYLDEEAGSELNTPLLHNEIRNLETN
jgi:6-phosphogluconolactonase